MKKIVMVMLFMLSALVAQDKVFVSILKNVSLVDVNNTIKNAKALKTNYSMENFAKLVKDWKKVEALYFAGDIDDNYIDTPRYIDIFHNLKEDLKVQMKRVVESKDEPKIALFKNSFKTINALEYILFNDSKITKREKALADVVVDSIILNLEDIKGVYENYLKGKQKSETWGNAVVLNTLISSTYKLKEWRVGDVAGLTSKYKGSADNSRAEYFLSKSSFSAIEGIVEAHEEVIDNKPYLNFETVAKEANASKEIKEAQNAITNIKDELKKLKKDDFEQSKKLYEAINKLHNAYYLSLTTQLEVTAKILDADGD